LLSCAIIQGSGLAAGKRRSPPPLVFLERPYQNNAITFSDQMRTQTLAAVYLLSTSRAKRPLSLELLSLLRGNRITATCHWTGPIELIFALLLLRTGYSLTFTHGSEIRSRCLGTKSAPFLTGCSLVSPDRHFGNKGPSGDNGGG